ncbi:MAG TPA: hypothetical protein VFL88_06665 [Gemmatimonadales bacterium]|jgi:hypothetical protein|nr:hypothetical protein [Gemmatimonadales bacterium]
MVRLSVGVLVLACAVVPSLHAQQTPPPSVVIAHTTHKQIAKAMGDVLKPQKFKVHRASKGQIVLSQDRGSVAQATGQVMHVRLEMVFALETMGDSIRVTPVEEAYYGGGGAELKRTVPIDKDRDSFENLLRMVKARVDSISAHSAGAS